MRLLIIDNRDSFTFNLVQALWDLTGVEPWVVRHDEPFTAAMHDVDAVVISPGPGHPGEPADVGLSMEVLARVDAPTLGVCLGMQAMCAATGASVVRAPRPMHGLTSAVDHDGKGLFAGIAHPMEVVRYHSLAVTDLPEPWVATAWVDGVLMGVRHRSRPWWGVQFHPESVGTHAGRALLANFLRLAGWSCHKVTTPAWVPPPPRVQAGMRWRALKAVEPAHAYRVLFADEAASYWLDGGSSRYSFMGAPGPHGSWMTGRVGEALQVWTEGSLHTEDGTVFEWLAQARASLPTEGPPVPLRAGLVGYLGYELKADTEGVQGPRSQTPDAMWMVAGRALAFDHETGEVWAMVLRADDPWLDDVEEALAAAPGVAVPRVLREPPVVQRHSDREYAELVRRCQGFLEAGESYELCLTTQAHLPVQVDAVELFSVMRLRSPTPHGALVRFGDVSLVSASPERFLRIDGTGGMEARPIKGTAARRSTADADAAAAVALQTSIKDRAENLMITDLLRNDLGRVCERGSVHVPELFSVESYATVHQLVSVVKGQLRAGIDPVDGIAACFPGGSMTGAPKVRSMQILQELERGPRGVYSGAFGYIDGSGNVDLGMVIRSAVCTSTGVTVGAGGAVVVLSDPEAEVAEMRLKMRGVVEAVAECGWVHLEAADGAA